MGNFNSHSRKESDYNHYNFIQNVVISIHTLVKRVTTDDICDKLIFNISIHTLVKRVTIVCGVKLIMFINFNSHSRKESDKWTNR